MPGPTPFPLAGVFDTLCHVTAANETDKDARKRSSSSGPTQDVAGAHEKSQNPVPPSKAVGTLEAPTPLGLTPCLQNGAREAQHPGSCCLKQGAGTERARGPHSALLPHATPRGKPGLLGSEPSAWDKTPPLTQLLHVGTEVHRGNCISVAFKMPLQRRVLLGETRVKGVKAG